LFEWENIEFLIILKIYLQSFKLQDVSRIFNYTKSYKSNTRELKHRIYYMLQLMYYQIIDVSSLTFKRTILQQIKMQKYNIMLNAKIYIMKNTLKS